MNEVYYNFSLWSYGASMFCLTTQVHQVIYLLDMPFTADTIPWSPWKQHDLYFLKKFFQMQLKRSTKGAVTWLSFSFVNKFTVEFMNLTLFGALKWICGVDIGSNQNMCSIGYESIKSHLNLILLSDQANSSFKTWSAVAHVFYNLQSVLKKAKPSTAIFVAGLVGEALIGWVEGGWVKGGVFRHPDYVTEASSPGDLGIKYRC